MDRQMIGVRESASDDRGVSEMVGFIIVIGLIMSSISIIYFNGVPALQNEREAQKMNSVQSAFELFQGNVAAIMDGRATSRGTQISLAGDELELVNDPTHRIDVSVERPDGKELCPENICNTSYKPIRFLSGQNAVWYSNGAVIRRSTANASAMVSRPNWIHTDETLILPIVRTTGRGAAAGTTTVQILAEKTSESSRVVRNESGLNVTINVTTQRPIAWRTFGVEHGDVDVDFNQGGASTVTIRIQDLERVIHAKKVIDISFI